jgi:hypothetical protein
MIWINEGNGSAADILEDQLIFRNLQPISPELPGLMALKNQLGIPEGVTPRKLDPMYGKVVVQILTAAQELRNPGVPLKELIYIGDTPGSDGTAFRHIQEAGEWQGAVLIVNETGVEPTLDVNMESNYVSALGNHWGTITEFDKLCLERGFILGEATTVILDLDKTILGGRGRNDQVINEARVAAVEHTVKRTLEEDFALDVFREQYQVLNAQQYHFFTADNQDYIAYLCILLGSGLVTMEELLRGLRNRKIQLFKEFLELVETRKHLMSRELSEFHRDFQERYLSGDPTPLKAFRRREYLETIKRMGRVDEDISADAVLETKIALTGEVYRQAQVWKERGTLLFGLSDKPDEASIPTSQQAADGLLPIHRVETAIVSAV